MSSILHEITSVRGLLFWLRGVDPGTPIRSLSDGSASVTLELVWAGKPSNAHMVRIGQESEKDDGDAEDEDDGR